MSADLIQKVAKATDLEKEDAFSWIKAVIGVAGEKMGYKASINDKLNPYELAVKRSNIY